MLEKYGENEDGFTLIEILVVILIIGILAAIAIPVFLNQRKTAADAALNSDARNAVTAIQTYIANNKGEKLPITATVIKPIMGGASSGVSNGTTLAISGHSEEWCVLGENKNANMNTWGTAKKFVYYNTRKGGWQDNGTMWTGDDCAVTTGVNWTFIN